VNHGVPLRGPAGTAIPWVQPYNPRVQTSLARAAARFLDFVLHCLPPALLLALADLAGELWFLLLPGRRRIARENLRIAFGPEAEGPGRNHLIRASCRSLARVFAEMALADRLLASPAQARRRLHLHGAWPALAADHAAGRAGVIVTAHLGNWELGARAVRHRGLPLKAMARPLRSPLLEAFVTRRRGGAEQVIGKIGGLSEVVRSLRQGCWVALLADQNAGRHGLFVPFFGLAASTFPTPAALGLRLDVPVYLGVCLRRPGELSAFDVHLEALPRPTGEGSSEARIEAMVGDLNRRLEGWIRREPGQYNWGHRRWKTRPPGRDESEPGRPYYARLWPLTPEGVPMYGRTPEGPQR